MRKIEFIAPVEAMRGNLSGDQKLTYPTQNNAAWDAPEGKRSYATNYRPTYIGAKRAADGKTYFATKRRQAVKMTDAVRLQMAVLSASSVIANILMTNLTVLSGLEERYRQTAPEGWSFKRWIMDRTKGALRNKQHLAFMGTSLGALFVKNPYLSTQAPAGGTSIDSSYPQDLLVKFWGQLASNPVLFSVEGMNGVAHEGDDFDTLAEATYNNLHITTEAISGSNYVTMGGLYLLFATATAPQETDYVTSGDIVDGSLIYTLTSEQPQ